MVTIEITDIEALIFRFISECRAWEIRNGSITIYFDGEGTPVKGERRETFSTPKASILIDKK